MKTCQNCTFEFPITPEDFAFYEKMSVPAPTFCPDCRLQRRFAWRNERAYYHTVCGLCQKKMISIHPPEAKYPVYCHACWWGEGWDGRDYGRDYDFSKPFFTQYKELLDAVPQIAMNGHATNVNCEYANYVVQSKNCYLIVGGGFMEEVMFGQLNMRSTQCAELMMSSDCECCYEIFHCVKCYKLCFGKNSSECRDSWFMDDCRNCHDCIKCAGLRNASYCYENQQLSKEEYLVKKEEFLKELHSDPDKLREDFAKLVLTVPKRFANFGHADNCTGDYMAEGKNCKNSFYVNNGENASYSADALLNIKDTRDATSCGLNCELLHEVMTGSMNIQNIRCSSVIRNNCTNMSYCFGLNSCNDLFGCVGLNKKKFYILNKQYPEEEYKELVPKIIAHMNDMPYIDKRGLVYKYGEFFPAELSLFPYNDSVAQEYFPLSAEEANRNGYYWREPERRNYTIGGDVLACAHGSTSSPQVPACTDRCTQAFKIIPQEKAFYEMMNLPTPSLCPNCRHARRLKQKNPMKLWHRKCMKAGCQNEFETTYSPERPEIVYCESCYQQAVV